MSDLDLRGAEAGARDGGKAAQGAVTGLAKAYAGSVTSAVDLRGKGEARGVPNSSCGGGGGGDLLARGVPLSSCVAINPLHLLQ